MRVRIAVTAAAVGAAIILAGCSSDKERNAGGNGGIGAVKPTPTIAPPPSEGGSRVVTAARAAPNPEADPGRTVVVADVPKTVARGTAATAVFVSRPGNMCQLELRYSDGVHGQRLPPTTSDDTGQVGWTWEVASDATTGDATAYVVCSGGSRGEARITIT